MFQIKYTPNDIMQIVAERLPSYKKACEQNCADAIITHQDAFGSDLGFEEILLLGLAIKYAGFFGLPVMIMGNHNETVNEKK